MEMSYYMEDTDEEKNKLDEELEEKIEEKEAGKMEECEGIIEEEEERKQEEKTEEGGGKVIGGRRRKETEEEKDERRRRRQEIEMNVDDKLIEHYYGRYLELEEVYCVKDNNKIEQEKEELKVLIRKDKERISNDKGEGRETKRQDVVSFLNQSNHKRKYYHNF